MRREVLRIMSKKYLPPSILGWIKCPTSKTKTAASVYNKSRASSIISTDGKSDRIHDGLKRSEQNLFLSVPRNGFQTHYKKKLSVCSHASIDQSRTEDFAF